MPTGKVAGLVGKHADDLVRCFGVKQGAGIDEDMAAVHYKSVEGAIVEHHHPHALLREVGGAQDRRRVFAQQLLDFGIADDRHTARGGILRPRRLKGGAAAGDHNRERDSQRERTARWRHALRPDRCPVLDHALGHWIA